MITVVPRPSCDYILSYKKQSELFTIITKK